jgi:hypothetical protein
VGGLFGEERELRKEKQIEEMASDIAQSGMLDCRSRCRIVAEELYYKGYSKQSENVIEFPCKPGQTLWFPSEYYDSPFPIYVTHLEIYEEETIIYSDGGSEWQIEDIGKTIFLTKEEAEQAITKKRGGE